MAKLKTFLICMVVLAIVTSSLADEQQNNNHKKQSGRKRNEAKLKKKPQADAPLPSKKKCMCNSSLYNLVCDENILFAVCVNREWNNKWFWRKKFGCMLWWPENGYHETDVITTLLCLLWPKIVENNFTFALFISVLHWVILLISEFHMNRSGRVANSAAAFFKCVYSFVIWFSLSHYFLGSLCVVACGNYSSRWSNQFYYIIIYKMK